MKTVSFVQANFRQGPISAASYYLPYSIGCIWSYAQQSEYIKNNYVLEHVIWKREPINQTAEKLATQTIVGISVYVWNKNYSYVLARKIKEINPTTLIVIGGPEPAIADTDFFQKHPYIDIIIKNEGELVFREILENLDSVNQISGIVFNNKGKAVDTGSPARIKDLEILPSPYLGGFFDDIIQNNPDVKEWSMTIETNRGCPYQCTFCDWGSLTYSKVLKLSLERIFNELEWAGKHKMFYVSLADANFGIFVERDNAIIDKFIEVQKKYGFPRGFITSYAKNQKKEVLSIIEKLIKESPADVAGHIVSLQTLNENTLSIIKRKNLEVHNLKEILTIAEQKNVPVGTELILGLPGDNLTAWKETMFGLFDLNIHQGIDIFFCQVLENTELNQVQTEIYDIKYKPNFDYFNQNLDQDQEILESINVITENSTFSNHDMIQAVIFNWFIITFHSGGFTNFYSRYLNHKKISNYKTFYNEFFDFISKDQWVNAEIKELESMYNMWLDQGTLSGTTINGVAITGWNLWYKSLFKISANEEISIHLQKLSLDFFNRYEINRDIELLQNSYPVFYHNYKTFPKEICTDNNVYSNFVLGAPLTSTSETLTFDFVDSKDYSETDFLEKIYFRRRRNFGKAHIQS